MPRYVGHRQISGKLRVLQMVSLAGLVTAVFSLRWRTCLPFSGYVPVINDPDTLTIFGRYLVYAKEALSFPIGRIVNLGFPYQVDNVAHCSMPIFPFVLKPLSRLCPSLGSTFYFVPAEILSVFVTAILVWVFLDMFHVQAVMLRLLGMTLICLSFPLLYRSSGYYGVSFGVAYFPVSMFWACCVVALYRKPGVVRMLVVASVLPLALLVDNYLSLGILIMTSSFVFMIVVECFRDVSKDSKRRFVCFMGALIVGVLLLGLVSRCIGYFNDLSTPLSDETALLHGRYSEGWGYGGGSGGGFHIADLLSVVIPPEESGSIAANKLCGPTAYLANVGFPLTTADLQDGQYEGFAYVGTVTIMIFCFLVMVSACRFLRSPGNFVLEFRTMKMAKYYLKSKMFSLPVILGVSALVLYAFSWGYVLHVGGVRFDNILMPSVLMAAVFPKLLLARSLGRLAMVPAIFVILATVVWFARSVESYMSMGRKLLRIIIWLFILTLIGLHVGEIWGYLDPPSATRSNGINDVLDEEDLVKAKGILCNRNAIMVVPQIRDNMEWTKICYCLALHSGKPLSGASIAAMSYKPEYIDQYASDREAILGGNIHDVVEKYGDVAIAAPLDIARAIANNADLKLDSHEFLDRGFAILTLSAPILDM